MCMGVRLSPGTWPKMCMGVRLSPGTWPKMCVRLFPGIWTAYQDPYPKTDTLTFSNTMQSPIAPYLLSPCPNHSGLVILGHVHFVTAHVSSCVQRPIMSENTISQ